MNEFKLKLPSTVMVGGDLFPIKTNFSFWVRFSQLIQDKATILGDLDYIYEGTPPYNRIDGYNALMEFYNPVRELPRPSNNGNTDKVIDYVTDFNLIYAGFLELYDIDLYDEHTELHWHKFLMLLDGLHDTKLNEVIGYRCYNPNDKTKPEQRQKELKRVWELPQNRELSQATKDFNALFN